MYPWLTQQQLMLSQQINSGLLPHAILITGASGAGKVQLAQWLTELLICHSPTSSDGISFACRQCKSCLLHAKSTFPDHLYIFAEKTTIGVEQVRAVSQFFEKTAQLGHDKVAFIEQAELMTISAANALLKTLEEPTENSFIVLTTVKAEKLLPTIVSRCRLVDIRPPMGEHLANAINSDTSDKSGARDKFSNITHLPELVDADKATQFKHLEQSLLSFLEGRFDRHELLSLLENHSDAFRWLEKILCNQMRGYYQWRNNEQQSPTKNSQPIGIEKKFISSVYQLVLSNSKTIMQLPQANSRYILEKLLIDIDMMRLALNK